METFVYVMDEYIPTDLTKKEVLDAFKEDKLKPFEFVRDIVEDKGVKGISGITFYDAYFKRDEFLIEYLVDFSAGKIAVKVIGSNDPRRMLAEYYRYIQQTRA